MRYCDGCGIRPAKRELRGSVARKMRWDEHERFCEECAVQLEKHAAVAS